MVNGLLKNEINEMINVQNATAIPIKMREKLSC